MAQIYHYELYHHGVKGMKWGVRKARRIQAREKRRAERDSKLTPEQRKKRSNIKKTIIIGSAAVGTCLAAVGSIKVKKYLDNRKRMKSQDEFIRRLTYEVQKKAFEQQQARDAARAAQRKADKEILDKTFESFQDDLMKRFKQETGLG